MLRFWFKKGKNRGFSLAELLAVVAILGILAAIAIPSAVSIQRDLKMLELNDTARQIFIAAQNQLTALRAANGRDALPPPVDQAVLDVEDGNSIHYVTQDNPQFDELLPAGAIDSTLFGGGKTAVIEYNPQSSSIYAVFYFTEKEFTYAATGMPRDDDAGKAARREKLVGYYGGDAADVPTIDVIEKPDITIENTEELKLLIDHTAALASTTQPDYADIVSDLCYTITITQVGKEDTGRNQVSFRYDPKGVAGNDAEISWQENGKKVEMVLDSLTGPHFAALAGKGGASAIEPGADITVSVQIDYTQTEGAIEKHSVPYQWKSIEVNSLFAACQEETVDGKPRSIYQVAYGRHLQNLEERISGVGAKADSEISVQYIEQTRDIDWSYYSKKEITAYDSSWAMGGDGQLIPPEKLETGAFLSITNDKIKSFDGQNRKIKNLRLVENRDKMAEGATGNSVGLFGWIKGADQSAELKDISLVNPYAKGGAGSGNIGTLAGHLEKAKLENCRAYLDEDGIKAEKAATNNKERGAVANTASGASAGGLVGEARLVTFDQCFAALPRVQGGMSGTVQGNTGGLIGKILSDKGGSASQFSKCFADTTELSGYNVAGFIGYCAGNVSVGNSYAVGMITNAAGTKAGFTTQLLGKADTCYSAVTLKTDSTLQQQKELNGFVPSGNGTCTACYYLVDAVGGPVSVPKKNSTDPEPVSYVKLKKFASTFGGSEPDPEKPGENRRIWNNSDVDTTKAYTMKPYSALGELAKKVDKKLYSDTEYPFPRLAAFNHYGNWPLPAKTGSLAYYEIYTDGQIGLEGWQAGGSVLDTTLKLQEGKVVKRDGYAWIGNDLNGPDTVQLTWRGKKISLSKDNTLSGKVQLAFYPLPVTILQDSTKLEGNAFYQQAIIDDVQTGLWFNPHFAKTAAHTETETPPVRPSQMIVRSARQLAALGQHDEYWALSIAQQLDIDFTEYDKAYIELAQRPIGTKGSPFSKAYNGQCHTITSTGIAGGDTDPYVGLFGYATGTLQNIVFRGKTDNDGSTISGITSAGALAGYASGTISNCAVSGFTIYGGYAGGLIGEYAGNELSNCSSACQTMTGENAGGLVGRMSDAEIRYCYAVGTVNGSEVSAGVVAVVDGAGGTIATCYAACTIQGEGKNYGVAPGRVNGCYYLSDTIQNSTAVTGANAASYQELAELSLSGFGKAVHTYPDTRNDPPYPFLAAVQDGTGSFVHYGDWPNKAEEPEISDIFMGIARASVSWSTEPPLVTINFYGASLQDDGSYTVDLKTPQKILQFKRNGIENGAYFVYFPDKYKNDWGISYAGNEIVRPLSALTPFTVIDLSNDLPGYTIAKVDNNSKATFYKKDEQGNYQEKFVIKFNELPK